MDNRAESNKIFERLDRLEIELKKHVKQELHDALGYIDAGHHARIRYWGNLCVFLVVVALIEMVCTHMVVRDFLDGKMFIILQSVLVMVASGSFGLATLFHLRTKDIKYGRRDSDKRR